MTTELTKAAQQAHTPEHIAGVDHAHELLRRMGYHRDGDWFIHANRRGAEAIHVSTISTIVNAGQLALTQRPAAQEVDEREAFEAWFDDYYDKACAEFGGIDCTDPKGIAEDAWQARASLPAPQQATPEPVGEVVYACPDELEMLRQRTVKHCLLSTFKAHGEKDVTLYTHPAPGVTEVWTDEQCLEFMCVALRHVEYKRGTKGPTCDDIRLGVARALAAAQAKGEQA